MIRTSLSFRSRKAGEGIAAEPASPGIVGDLPAFSPRVRTCDYEAAAGVFVRIANRLRYRSFEHAKDALRYANEELTPSQFLTCAMEIDDARFVSKEIRSLYTSPRFPRRPTANA